MYAVIKAGGQQFRVEQDAEVQMDLMDAKEGSAVEFKDVLLIQDDNKTVVGTPFVKNAVVKGEVVGISRGPKLRIVHKPGKGGSKKTIGHRQSYSVVKIKAINYGG